MMYWSALAVLLLLVGAAWFVRRRLDRHIDTVLRHKRLP
jgi:hypothetical protein